MSESEKFYHSAEWEKGGIRRSNGRVYIYCPSHPSASRDGYIPRSHFVWEAHHGPLPAGFIIHHRNEDPSDDRIENLQALTDEEHKRLHSLKMMRTVAGRFKKGFKCRYCNLPIEWGRTADDGRWVALRADLMGEHRCLTSRGLELSFRLTGAGGAKNLGPSTAS